MKLLAVMGIWSTNNSTLKVPTLVSQTAIGLAEGTRSESGRADKRLGVSKAARRSIFYGSVECDEAQEREVSVSGFIF